MTGLWKHRTPWAQSDYDELRRLISDGMAARHIAKRMERSEDAIRSKASDLGWSFKPTK